MSIHVQKKKNTYANHLNYYGGAKFKFEQQLPNISEVFRFGHDSRYNELVKYITYVNISSVLGPRRVRKKTIKQSTYTNGIICRFKRKKKTTSAPAMAA